MDPFHAGWWENYSHACRGNSGGFCVQGLSAGGHAITSAVEPGCGQTHKNTR